MDRYEWQEMVPLAELREEIDVIDSILLYLIWLRGKRARNVGRIKLLRGGRIEDIEREREILERRKKMALQWDLDPDWIGEIWQKLMDYAKDVQYQETF